MTQPRRKPRTASQRPTSRPAAVASAMLAAGLLLTSLVPAQAHEWRTFLRTSPEPTGAAPAAEAAATTAEVVVEAPIAEGVEPEAFVADESGTPATAAEPAGPVIPTAAADTPKNPCGDDAIECKDALEKLRADALAGVSLDIRVSGRAGSDYPCECRLEGETFQPRRFATTMFTWKAAGYCHKPLYFEDWELERYGHSYGPLDPILSAAHFFTTLPVLPYKMGVELPWECVYPLGYYRPGSCAPWTIPAVPISCRGLAVEAATVTGIVFLLP